MRIDLPHGQSWLGSLSLLSLPPPTDQFRGGFVYLVICSVCGGSPPRRPPQAVFLDIYPFREPVREADESPLYVVSEEGVVVSEGCLGPVGSRKEVTLGASLQLGAP